ncbi:MULTISPECIES: hypothetical protein [Halomonadaceae]|jgi:hypothetical protein|uniref:Uncharacterized protein n=2 Tax=Vreelandella TaxID=3137766 RepID=A0A857GMQ0_9GAMM|nr:MULTISPECIES: hypothetical protein [Halomonas]AIA76079.1 hypothetical protein FF32_14905 [Halomonas campaniensis]ASK17838.1 hypothetical protein CEK60_00220 [Halomonas sp. N3-2A]KAE8439438.1 hypothetical protein F1978_04235 [Halomonas piezotolerans]MCG7590126.1 hypothetical protein [Halomonas sp. McD50-5]MCG7615824.1 hypothetical protein [Halomonas sp. McD50-4]
MSQHEAKRRLLSRLSRQFGYTAPALALVASGLAFQAHADEPTDSMTNVQQAPMMLAEGGAEGGGEGEKPEGEGEAEGGAEAG